MRRWIYILLAVLTVFAVATVGGSSYLLDYALAPDSLRRDTAARYDRLFKEYPETRPWIDSLRREGALRDTFVVMPTGERHHALYAPRPDARGVAVLIHGWREQAIGMLPIARLYHQLLGYHVLLPDLHAHGLSEGTCIQMGWKDREDILRWMTLASGMFGTDRFVVHGVSMGAATTMGVAGEPLPQGVGDIRYVEDCGYTSVWDEFHEEIGKMFGLPDFPLMYTASWLCKWKYGWDFREASPLRQVAKCRYPMLFIHGDADDFVPFWMVRPLYDAKPQPKRLWITRGVPHALSYRDDPDEYAARLRQFVVL